MNFGVILKVNWLKTLIVNQQIQRKIWINKFPLYIGYQTKLHIGKTAKICIVNLDESKNGDIKIGITSGSMGIGRGCNTAIYINDASKLLFNGKADIAKNSFIDIDSNAVLELGDGYSSNAGLKIKCTNSIKIGKDCILGWNTTILDKDGHDLVKNMKTMPRSVPVSISDHVWIGANVTILKGSNISNDCVVGIGSLVTGSLTDSGCVYAGVPARKISTDVEWKK